MMFNLDESSFCKDIEHIQFNMDYYRDIIFKGDCYIESGLAKFAISNTDENFIDSIKESIKLCYYGLQTYSKVFNSPFIKEVYQKMIEALSFMETIILCVEGNQNISKINKFKYELFLKYNYNDEAITFQL